MPLQPTRRILNGGTPIDSTVTGRAVAPRNASSAQGPLGKRSKARGVAIKSAVATADRQWRRYDERVAGRGEGGTHATATEIFLLHNILGRGILIVLIGALACPKSRKF